MLRQILLSTGLALTLSSVASATTMVELSTEQMVDASDSIVRGTVTQVWVELDPKGRVWTQARISVDGTLKGDPANELVVAHMGGEYGGVGTHIEGTPRFSVGEDGLFFVEQLKDHLSVVGMHQGKYTVKLDPVTRSEIAVRYLVPISKVYDHRFIPLPPVSERVGVVDLEAQILERVEVGWDGHPIPGASPERLRRINRIQPGVEVEQ